MRKQYLVFFTALTIGFIFLNFTLQTKDNSSPEGNSNFEIPEDIQPIIEQSCFGCHNTESNNDKAKKKLLFDKLGELKTYKLVGKLADMADILKEGDMPPKKAIEKFPEIKLSGKDRKTLINWADKTAESLTK